jgi:hypothetical protein
MKKLIFTFFFFSFFIFVSPTSAHDFSLSYTSISVVNQKINVAITAPNKNILSLFPEENKSIDEIDLNFFVKPFAEGFTITNNNDPCIPKLTNIQKIENAGQVAYQFEYACKQKLDKLHFSYDLFFTVSKNHENITDFYVGDFGTQIILSQKQKTYDLPVKEIHKKTTTYYLLWNITNFLTMGITHIFIGYDHILFLLGLLLLTKRFRNLMKVITSFTVAHSMTLILSTLSVISLPPRFTESLIALSIVYVALENILILKKIKSISIGNLKFKIEKWKFLSEKKLWVVTFLFGLIHGFGFSYVIREAGLPKEGLIPSLISFNVGVELGQIIIISSIFPLLWYLRKKRWDTRVAFFTSVSIGTIGLFWLVQRAFFV